MPAWRTPARERRNGGAFELGRRPPPRQLAEKLVAERTANGPFTLLPDLTSRVQLSVPQVEALATAGALGCFGMSRREALWAAGAAATGRPDRLPGVGSSSHIRRCRG
ncbi:hypothetical protein ACQKB2_18060 [Mycobacterium tuberculosis]